MHGADSLVHETAAGLSEQLISSNTNNVPAPKRLVAKKASRQTGKKKKKRGSGEGRAKGPS